MDKYIRNEHERVDNLQIRDLKIIQNSKLFCFGIDSVILSWFASQKMNQNFKVIDLGTGTGILPLLIWAKSQTKIIHAIEIQDYFVDMAKRSIMLNKIEDEILIFKGDIKNLPEELDKNSYDMVITNPPYMKDKGGIPNTNRSKAISRHEVLCNLRDVIQASKKLLKSKGKLFMVHRPHRLVDLLCIMREYDIEPKSLAFVYPQKEKEPNMVLIEAVKGGRPMLKIDESIIVYKENGEYTDKIFEIYGMD